MAKFEQPFDQFIKEKLETFSSQDTPDWRFMQEKIMDAENDLLFDRKIKQTLDDLKVDSPQIHWEQFLVKKNRQAARRNKIITARVIESCLILLLLWTIDNIGITNIIKPPIHSQLKSNPLVELNSRNFLSEEHSAMNSTDVALNNQDNSRLVEKSDEPQHKGFDRKKVNRMSSLDDNTLHKKLRKPSFINPLSKKSIASGIIENNDLKLIQSTSGVSNESLESKEEIPLIDNQQILPQAPSNLETKDGNEIILPFDRKVFELSGDETKPNLKNQLPNTIALLKPLASNKSVLLNVHSGLMMNVVLSPAYLNPNSDKVYVQLRPGFQTAINIGFQSKKYMLESGLIYQYLSYEPNQSEQLGSFYNGYFKLHFQKITSQLVTIPVLIHFNLLKRTSWSLTSKVGLSLSVALKNDFKLDTIRQGQSLVLDYSNSEISSRVNNISNHGILDGGDFGVNSFTNLVAGIRYTKKFRTNLSFYTEFEVNKMIGSIGFGPNGDRFISANFNTGISFKL